MTAMEVKKYYEHQVEWYTREVEWATRDIDFCSRQMKREKNYYGFETLEYIKCEMH